jgi:hypothetical protein
VEAEEVRRTVLASQRFEIERSDRRDLWEAEVDGRSVLASPGLGARLSRLSSKGEPSRGVEFGSRKTSPCWVMTICESIDREVEARALLEAGFTPLDVGGLRRDDTPDVYHCRLDISSKNKGNAIAEITDTSDKLKPEKMDQAWVLTAELVNEMSDS